MAQQYQIISAQGVDVDKVLQQLVEKVGDQLRKGWTTTGGVSLISESGFGYYIALQAVIKD